MHASKALILSGMVTALMSGTALVHNALAQRAGVLQPETAWSIKSVDRGENSYCAIARRFEENVILTLARNANAETSLALDFKNRRFDEYSSAKITLDAGVQQRKIKAKPRSEKAFVLKLGRDEQFYDTLARTDALNVKINEDVFSLNLSGMDRGRDKLFSCLQEFRVTAADGEDKESALAEVAAVPVKQVKVLKAENERLHGLIQSAEAEKTKSAADQADVKALQKKVAKLQKENEKLENAAKSAKEKLAAETSKQSSDSAMVAELQKENLSLLSKLAELETAAGNNTVDRDEHRQLMGKLKRAQDQNKWFEQRIKDLHDDKVKYLQEVSEYRAKLRKLEENISQKKESYKRRQARIAELERKLGNLAKERTTLQSTVTQTREALKSKIAQLNAENETLRERIQNSKIEADQQLKARVDTLLAENELLNQELERQTQSLQSEYEEKVSSLKSQLASLEEKLAGQQGTRQAVLQFKEQIQALKAEKEELVASLESLRQRSKNLEKTAAKATEAQKQRVAAAKKTIARLEADLKDARARNQEFETIVADLKNRAEELETRADESTQADEENEELRADVKTLEEENEELRDDLEIAQAKNEKFREVLSSAREGVSEFKAFAQAAKDKEEELNLVIAEAREQIEALGKSNADLLEKVAKLQSSQEAFSLTKADFEESIQNLESKNADLQEKLSAQVETNENAAKKIALLQEEKKALQQEMAEQSDEVALALEEKTEALAELQSSFDSLQKENEELKARLQKKESKLLSLKKQEEDPALAAKGSKDKKEDVKENVRLAAVLPEPPVPAKKPGYISAGAQAQDLPKETVAFSKPEKEPATRPEDLNTIEAAAGDPEQNAGNEYIAGRVLEGSEAQRQEADMVRKMKTAPESTASDSSGDVEKLLNAPANTNTNDEGKNISAAKTTASGAEKPAETETGPMPIKKILTAAKIPLNGSIETLNKPDKQLVSYQWLSGDNLYGSAHQKQLTDANDFDGLVQAYLENTEARCEGDFAISPSLTKKNENVRIDSYEIACIGPSTDSSASLVFFSAGDRFTVLAHETGTDGMATAMEYRDRLIKTINNS